MEEKILDTIKKLLGIDLEFTGFDVDIITHINSTFLALNQMGIGEKNFYIEDNEATWDDFLGDIGNLNSVKSYIYLKVRMLFDPPTSGLIDSYKNAISEIEWRLVNHEL